MFHFSSTVAASWRPFRQRNRRRIQKSKHSNQNLPATDEENMVRGFAKYQLAGVAHLYCFAKREGRPMQEVVECTTGLGAKTALHYATLLDEKLPPSEGQLKEEDVLKLLVELYDEEHAAKQRALAEASPLSMQERLTEAMLELRANLHERGIVAKLATKHHVKLDKLTACKKQMKYVLERDPPVSDEILRRLMLAHGWEPTTESRKDKRELELPDDQEQLLVDAMIDNDPLDKMSESQFGVLLRSYMLEMFKDDEEKRAFVESYAFRSWNHQFRKRHMIEFGLRLNVYFLVARDDMGWERRMARNYEYHRQLRLAKRKERLARREESEAKRARRDEDPPSG